MNHYHLSAVGLASKVKCKASLLCSTLLILGVSVTSSLVNAQNPFEQLTRLNQAGLTGQAYALASELLPQWEGEPAFDLQYGIAAVDSGFFSEGIFALERVTMNEPSNDYARLELARAYFAAQEDERARVEFERVLAANPPDEVRENIRPYLDTISARESRRRAVWRGSIDYRTGYDSNINASTDDDLAIRLDLLPNVLNAPEPKEDSFGTASGVLSYSKPLSATSDLSFSGNLSHRENSSGDLPQTVAGFSAGYSKRRNSNTYNIALQGNRFFLENSPYRDMAGLSLSWRHQASPQTSLTIFGQASDLNYDSSPVRDSLLVISGVSVQHLFAAKYRPSLTLGVTAGFEDANDDSTAALGNTERDMVGASLALGLSFSPNFQMTTSIRAQRSEYAEELFFPAVLREDLSLNTNIAFSWRVADNWLVGLDATVTDNDSTAEFPSYQREQISLSARYLLR